MLPSLSSVIFSLAVVICPFVFGAPNLLPHSQISTLNAPDMMRMQMHGEGPQQMEIQIHQVAIDDYPLLTALKVMHGTSSKCMKDLGIEGPDFRKEIEDAFGIAFGDGSDSNEAEDSTPDEPEGGSTGTTPTPNNEQQPTTTPMKKHPPPQMHMDNFMARMLARFARRFAPVYHMWKGRVEGFQKIAEMLQSDKMNKFIDSLTEKQFRDLAKCVNKDISTQMKTRIDAEWEPINALMEMLQPKGIGNNKSTKT